MGGVQQTEEGQMNMQMTNETGNCNDSEPGCLQNAAVMWGALETHRWERVP